MKNHLDHIRNIINSPWVLLMAPFLVGGFWLVRNPELITHNLDKPYLLLAGPALIGSIFAGWLIHTSFKTIAHWCASAWQAFQDWRKQSGSAFWIVIAIFLLVSVSESGSFFNGLLGSHDLFGILGYASAFVIDLVAVECMRARLSAVRMRDSAGQNLYLFGVVACAGLSAYANTYTALIHFVTPEHTQLPMFMIVAAPWLGCAFPLLIIFLSFTADYTADQASTKLDPESYREQEQKRITLLEYQRDMLKSRVEIEREIDTLSGVSPKEKADREFILLRWFFPSKQPNMQQVIENVLEQVNGTYKAQFDAMAQQQTALQMQITAFIQESKQATLQLQKQVNDQAIIHTSLDQFKTDYLQDINGLQVHVDNAIQSVIGQITESVRDMNITQDTPNNASVVAVQSEAIASVSDVAKTDHSIEITEEIKEVIRRYPIVEAWLSTGARSVSIQDIISGTKHTAQLVRKREKDGTFRKTRREGYYRIDSIIEWLKTEKLPAMKESKNDTKSVAIPPDNEVVINVDNGPNTDEHQAVKQHANGHTKDAINLENFIEMPV